ncbi:MAG: (d)CMP kinase [Thermodesulfobacteriota bacterium]
MKKGGAHRDGPVIAIDGPSGVGKTTVSRLLAQRLGYRYVNTGAMYRALALAAEEAGVDLESAQALAGFCSALDARYDYEKGSVILNGRDYSSRVATQHAGHLASIASSKKPVRDFLVAFQRRLGAGGRVVMEGRDIGTVVFPEADAKFFLDASHEVRASRRRLEVQEKEGSGGDDVSRNIRERDERDAGRALSPLKKAPDALYVDTGELTIEGVVQRLVRALDEKGVTV